MNALLNSALVRSSWFPFGSYMDGSRRGLLRSRGRRGSRVTASADRQLVSLDGAKFVLKAKTKADGTWGKDKARLVVRCFKQSPSEGLYAIYAPTSGMTTTCTVLARAVQNGSYTAKSHMRPRRPNPAANSA